MREKQKSLWYSGNYESPRNDKDRQTKGTMVSLFRGPLHLLKLCQTVLQILFVKRLVIWMPAAERGSSLSDICRSPHDPQLVHLPLCLVIRDKDVEIPRTDVVQHVQNRLLSGPSTRGLLPAATGCESGESPPGAI